MAVNMSTNTIQQTQNRRYDHIYDPVFTVSGARDHARLNATAARVQVERVPDSANYFSEIPSVYNSHSYRTNTVSELPGHIDVDFRGIDTSTRVVTEADVTGPNRAKHFRRPIIPLLHAAPPEILLAPRKKKIEDNGVDKQKAKQASIEFTGPRSQGTQTKLRDSEAQTKPYSPDYVIPVGEDPEILTLAGLHYGNGLPVSMREVEMIERARQKRKLLQSLPPITDEASFNLRKAMMEEQELLELEQREGDIQKTHDLHLASLREALQARKAESDFIAEQRVAAIHQQKVEEKDEQIAEIQRCRIKAMRKLSKSRRNVDSKPTKKDIVSEYSIYSSETYAPLLREGRFPDKNETGEIDISKKLKVLQSSKGLDYLERGMPASVTNANIKKPKHRKPHTASQRKQANLTMHLERMDKLLKSRKHLQHIETEIHNSRNNNNNGKDENIGTAQSPVSTNSDSTEASTPKWRKSVEKMARPPTAGFSDNPSEDKIQDEQTDIYNAMTLLQKLLRGRAIQNMMFEGKERRLELIRELRTKQTFNPAYDYNFASFDEDGENDNEQNIGIDKEPYRTAAALDAIQGEVISSSLDFFANELVRVQQEKRVRGYAAKALEERRRREMHEAGTRQAEQNVRKREEEMFRQLMQVHHGTIDSYFDEILADSIEGASALQAASELQIPQERATPRDSEKEGSSEDIVQELMSSLLLPHAAREHHQSKIKFEGRKFVHAAHQAIYDVVKSIETPADSTDDNEFKDYESKYE